METILTPYTAEALIDCSAAIVFAPHPDDEALGCGGLLAALTAAAIPVQAVFLTSGEYGENGREGAAVREEESRAAARLLGIQTLQFWHEPDRGVAYNERTIAAARQAILDAGADLILSPSIHEIHPDHRSTAWIVIEAARRLVNAGSGAQNGRELRVAMYEIGAPLHRVDVLIDISAQEAVKRAAIACYHSQLALHRYDELVLALNRFRCYTLPATVTSAEAYRLVDASALQQPLLLGEPELHRQERMNLVGTRAGQQKVAVLIRSSNRPTLTRTLDSVALQTWPHIEVYVLNASGEGHQDVPERAGSLPVRYLDSTLRVPRAAAANRLLESAQADLALFLDDDDWIAPDHISSLVTKLRDTPAAIAAYADVEYGQLVDEHWQSSHRFSADYDASRLLFENFLPIHAVLFPLPRVRDEWQCRFDTALEVFEDWDFWLQLSEHGDFCATRHLSAYYAQDTRGSSGVFAELPGNAQQKQQLRHKWLTRLSARRYSTLLDEAQRLYRALDCANARHADLLTQQAKLEQDARLESAGLHTLISAREQEIANLHRHALNLEQERENFRKHTLSLEQHALALEEIVRARDTEIAAANLSRISMDLELSNLRTTLLELQNASRSRRWLLGRLLLPRRS